MKRLYTYKDKEKLYKACSDARDNREADAFVALHRLIVDWGLLADYQDYREEHNENSNDVNCGA